MTKNGSKVFCENPLSKTAKSKRGPKSFKEKSTRQRGAGLVSRRETRKWENASAATHRSVRAGWRLACRYAGAYIRRKGIPMTFRKNNLHGGKLWANRNECVMTNKMAGEILERVYNSRKVTEAQLKQVRHTLSYSYYLMTAKVRENWPEVKAQWDSFRLSELPQPQRSLRAVRIPVPENLKEAWTKPWTPVSPWCLANFIVAAFAAWDYFVYGLRPNVDIMKVKTSSIHDINVNERFGATAMDGGRSKLQGNMRGTRPWKVYRVCCCRNGEHIPVPDQFPLDNNGNPTVPVTWNTVCPLAQMEFLRNQQGEGWMPYRKWRTTVGTYGSQNHGDVPGLANRWLQSQTNQAAFDANSGRKSLSRWLERLKIPYHQSHQIHGDLQCVWRTSYQNSLPKSLYEIREQSTDSDVACQALRCFASWLFDQKKPSIKEQLQGILATLG